MDQCITQQVRYVYTKTRVIYSVVITCQYILPSSQFNSLCNEFRSVWSMFVNNKRTTPIIYIDVNTFICLAKIKTAVWIRSCMHVLKSNTSYHFVSTVPRCTSIALGVVLRFIS